MAEHSAGAVGSADQQNNRRYRQRDAHVYSRRTDRQAPGKITVAAHGATCLHQVPTTYHYISALLRVARGYTPKGGHRRSKRRTKLYKGVQKRTLTLTLNSPFGVCSSSSNQTKLANCKLRNKTVTGKPRENQLLQCS